MAAAAAHTISAMDAAASPLGIWLAVRSPAVTGWAAPLGIWIVGVFGVVLTGSGLISWPTGVTLPSVAKPQFSRDLA